MTKMRIIILLLLMTATMTSQNVKKVIAGVDGETIKILVDTVQFKKFVVENVFPKNSFDKLEIRKALTFGDKQEHYYFIFLQDKNTNLKVAKWLEREKDKLYIVENFDENNYLQLLYFSCSGPAKCLPQVGIVGQDKGWSCEETFLCSVENTCNATKSLIVPD